MSRSSRHQNFNNNTVSRRPKTALSQIDLILGEQQKKSNKNTISRPLTPKGRPPPRKSSKYFTHTISSPIGDLAIFDSPEIRSTKKKKKKTSHLTPSLADESDISDISNNFSPRNQNMDVYLTFSLLKTLVSQVAVAPLLEKTPLFFRTLYTDGSLDPEIISSISQKLIPVDLRRFILNYSQEVNFYNSITKIKEVYDIEKVLCCLLPISRATVWEKTENADFIISHTMNEVLPINNSIVGYAILNGKDMVTGDPGNAPGFVIDVDMPFLRNCKSMVMLPISTAGKTVAVLQVVGFFNEVLNKQVEFPPYHIEVLKICRNIIQNRFYKLQVSQRIPSQLTTAFDDIENTDCQKVVKRFAQIFQDLIPCDVADIYEFNERERKLIRLTDSKRFDSSTGGISYSAAMITDPISVPHAKTHPAFNNSIDGLLTNRSVMSKSYFDQRNHYVITLRAKWKSPAFIPQDLKVMDEIAPVMCDAIKVANFISKESSHFISFKRNIQTIEIVNKTINLFVNSSTDPWSLFHDFTHQLFDCETCFVSIFDGQNMIFHPSGVVCSFEKCIAGDAYNYREGRLLNIDKLEENENENLDLSLYYDYLDLKMNISFAFPYRSFKRVVGAIELINPDPKLLDEYAQKMTSIACSFLLPNLTSESI